jgi:hypothetical protein
MAKIAARQLVANVLMVEINSIEAKNQAWCVFNNKKSKEMSIKM